MSPGCTSQLTVTAVTSTPWHAASPHPESGLRLLNSKASLQKAANGRRGELGDRLHLLQALARLEEAEAEQVSSTATSCPKGRPRAPLGRSGGSTQVTGIAQPLPSPSLKGREGRETRSIKACLHTSGSRKDGAGLEHPPSDRGTLRARAAHVLPQNLQNLPLRTQNQSIQHSQD